MNSIRIAIAAVALSASSLAFAADVHAAQTYGRDVATPGAITVSQHAGAQWLNAVPGRQGGFVQDARQATGASHSTANVVERNGRA